MRIESANGRPDRLKTFRDLATISVIAILVFVLASLSGVFEVIVSWSQKHEKWQIQELITALTILGLFFGIFSFRRWRALRHEIAERKRAEEGLQVANERLKYLLASTSVAIYTSQASSDYAFTSVTENIRQMVGYDPQEFIENPSFWIEHVHPEDRRRILKELPHLLEKENHNYEYRFLQKDGTYRWMRDEMRLMRDEHGTPTEIVGYWIDITDRKQVEEMFRDSEEKYRSLVESTEDSIYMVDKDCTYLFANERQLSRLGSPRDRVIGRRYSEFHTFEEDHEFTEKVNEVFESGRSVQYEHRSRRDDKYFLRTLSPVRTHETGKTKAVTVISKDITERKQIEEELGTEKQRFQTLTENAPFGMMVIDKEGAFQYINPKFRELFGYAPEDVPNGKTWFRKAYPDPTYRHHVISTWLIDLESFRPGEKRPRIFTVTCKDGTKKIINFISVQLRSGENLIACEDITERKRAEEALKESQQLLEKTFTSLRDAVFIIDAETAQIIDCNPAASRIFGYSREEMLGRPSVFLHVDEETLKEFRKHLYTGVKERGFLHLPEFRMKRKNGAVFPTEHSVAPLEDPPGKRTGWVSVVRDITERKQAEETIRKSEETAKQIAQENAIMAEIGRIVGSTLNIEEVYDRFAEEVHKLIPFERININIINHAKRTVTAAYTTGEVVTGRQAGDVFPLAGSATEEVMRTRSPLILQTGDRTELAHRLPGVLPAFDAGHRSMLIVPLISRDMVIGAVYFGSTKPKAFAERDLRLAERVANQIAGAIANAQLFTEFKQAEEALKRSEAQYRRIVETAEEGIWIIDAESRTTFVNRKMTELLGYAVEELVGKPLWAFMDEEGWAIAGDNLEYHRQGIKEHRNFKFRRKDGTELWAIVTTSAILDQEEQPTGALWMVTDITQRKHAEEEKRAIEEQFRQSQKMEAIGRLAGGIAHDFNNLMTVISGYSQLSLSELKEGDPLRENLKEIKNATERAAGLTRQLLAFSRRQILNMKWVNLNNILQDLDKMLRRVLGEDIELVTVLAEDLWGVKTDPGQIDQVILNLAVNARDAMPGGGKLTVETANVELDESYARSHTAVRPGHYVRLTVSDTGVGISPEAKDWIFEPFFTTKEQGKGTGLGLSTVYGIVKQSGGNIWVYSELGRGTTFKVHLPRADEIIQTIAPKPTPPAPLEGSETILVVEDEEPVRALARKILQGYGYKILEAANGQEALCVAQERIAEKVHLLLTDVVMPGMGGRELAERLMALRPEMKILYISGYTDTAIVHHGVLDPGVAFLQKPFSPTTLARKVREELDR